MALVRIRALELLLLRLAVGSQSLKGLRAEILVFEKQVNGEVRLVLKNLLDNVLRCQGNEMAQGLLGDPVRDLLYSGLTGVLDGLGVLEVGGQLEGFSGYCVEGDVADLLGEG